MPRRLQELLHRQRAAARLRALGPTEQQEAAVHRHADVFGEDGGDRIEAGEVAVHQHAALAGRTSRPVSGSTMRERSQCGPDLTEGTDALPSS